MKEREKVQEDSQRERVSDRVGIVLLCAVERREGSRGEREKENKHPN